MKRIVAIICIIFGLCIASSYAADFSVDGLYPSQLQFIYNGNHFGGTIFFKDTKNTSETLVLNNITKSCNKQIRGYYYNAARGLRLWPLDQDSLDVLKAHDISYNNLSIAGGLFICSGNDQTIYGSITHLLGGQEYHIIAGVDYNFINNSYLPNFIQNLSFTGGKTVGYIFDSNGGIASLSGQGLAMGSVCGNSIVEVGEICDEGSNNGKAGHCNTFCNGTVPPNSGGGGGGGGGGSSDITSTTPNTSTNNGLITTGLAINIHNVAPLQQPCPVEDSTYSSEVTQAFSFSYSMGITTQCPIQKANVGGLVTRKSIAKMISEFAINVLGKSPDAKKTCNFTDMKNESTEMNSYAKTACQLGIMGLNSNGKSNLLFSPNVILTRAQFGTMLSRLLRGDKNNGQTGKWYTAHLEALKQNSIMKNIEDPSMFEKKQNIMIMFYRIANSGK